MRLGVQVKKLQDRMEKLRLENKRYRETNRTAEFEAAMAALQQQVCHRQTDCGFRQLQQQAHYYIIP